VCPTLQSVRDQTFEDFECIVVDDGSADGEELKAVVEGLSDPRFRYVVRENGGGGAARNTGIDEAKGEFVAFLDSDDRWLPEKLAVQAEQLQRFPDRVVYCAAYVDRGVGKYWVRPSRGIRDDQDVGEYLFVANQFFPTPSLVLSTKIARAVRWDEDLKRGQDLDFALRLRAMGCRFEFLAEPLVIIWDNDESGRVSRAPGIENHLVFLGKHHFRWRARLGYRAMYLAYDLAKDRPLLAAKDLALGLVAGISPLLIARHTLRAFLPRERYRKVVNSFVALAGK
jgi:glycosyltransferase involved in cell wall biosynthesis